jgi:hypothetical protein
MRITLSAAVLFLLTIFFVAMTNQFAGFFKIIELFVCLFLFFLLCTIGPVIAAAIMERYNSGLIHLLVTLLVIGTGLYLTVFGIQNIRLSGASDSWPMVQGQVINSKLKTVFVPLGPAGTSSEQVLDFKYKYAVDGQDYTGKRIEWKLDKSSPSSYSYFKKYPKNSFVDTYYNPFHPKQSVLEPGFRWRTLTELFFGIIASISSIFNIHFNLNTNWHDFSNH